MHAVAWKSVSDYVTLRSPVFGAKTSNELHTTLPKPMGEWLTQIQDEVFLGTASGEPSLSAM